jgi:transposase-like protein
MVRKRYTPAQKAAIVLELLKEEDTLPAIASRHGVHPNLLRKWKAQALAKPGWQSLAFQEHPIYYPFDKAATMN